MLLRTSVIVAALMAPTPALAEWTGQFGFGLGTAPANADQIDESQYSDINSVAFDSGGALGLNGFLGYRMNALELGGAADLSLTNNSYVVETTSATYDWSIIGVHFLPAFEAAANLGDLRLAGRVGAVNSSIKVITEEGRDNAQSQAGGLALGSSATYFVGRWGFGLDYAYLYRDLQTVTVEIMARR